MGGNLLIRDSKGARQGPNGLGTIPSEPLASRIRRLLPMTGRKGRLPKDPHGASHA
jgi:hypothetical protein